VTRAPDALALLSMSSAEMRSLFRQHVEKGGTLTECDTRFGAGARCRRRRSDPAAHRGEPTA